MFAVSELTAFDAAAAYAAGMNAPSEASIALGLMRNAEALVSVMDGLADEAYACGRLEVVEPTVHRVAVLLRERGELRARLAASRLSQRGA